MKKTKYIEIQYSCISNHLKYFTWSLPMLTLLILFMAGTHLCAQGVYNYGVFFEGAEVFLFEDDVAVREAPSIGSDVIANLPIAYPLTIIGITDSAYASGGYEANWYEVDFMFEGEDQVGYTWGGSIAIVALPFMHDNDEVEKWFVFGISEYDEERNCLMAKAKIIEESNVISEIDFIPMDIIFSTGDTYRYGYTVYGTTVNGEGFTPDVTVFQLSFVYEACGFPNGDILLLWDGEQLHYGVERTEVSEAGLFYMYSDLILPSDEAGKQNHIVLIETQEEYEEDSLVFKNVETRTYVWDGTEVREKE